MSAAVAGGSGPGGLLDKPRSSRLGSVIHVTITVNKRGTGGVEPSSRPASNPRSARVAKHPWPLSMRSREAWITVLAAALGVDVASCKKEEPQTSPVGSVEVRAPSASVTASSAPGVSDGVDASDSSTASPPVDAGRRAAARQDAGEAIGLVNDANPADASDILNSFNSFKEPTCGVSNETRLNIDTQGNCGGRAGPLSTGSGSVGSPPPKPVPPSQVDVKWVSGDAPASGASFAAGIRPAMRACFQRALTQNPEAPDGTVTLTITVGPNGEVQGVSASATTLDASDVACMRQKIFHYSSEPSKSARTVVIRVDQRKTR